MKLLFVVLICAFVFLVCFLIDTLFKLIFPKSKLEKSKQVVRPPRRSAVIGVILTFAGVAMLVKNLAGTPDTLFLIGSAVAVIFGVLLLCTYFSVVIYYDDEGFLYKAWGHGKKVPLQPDQGPAEPAHARQRKTQSSLLAMRRSISTAPCRT